MENSYRFFRNEACDFFPCHKQPEAEQFNCLFCYCPLYLLGEHCGGEFSYVGEKVKDCTACHLPHLPEHYDVIVKKLMEHRGSV